MKIHHSVESVRQSIQTHRDTLRQRDGKKDLIGLVPTMGALHHGHAELIRRSVEQCQFTAVSIFVNPTQFGPNEDLDKYPRTLEADLELCREIGVDDVFVPDVSEIYGDDDSFDQTSVRAGSVSRLWEGECRPGHFDGVCTIVLKLFQVIHADVSFFGRKDYQQLAVLRQMVSDFHLSIQIKAVDTVREPDGLARSSRNQYLSDEERTRARCLSQSLFAVQKNFSDGQRSTDELEKLLASGLKDCDSIDYAVVVDAITLEHASIISKPSVALVAAHVGSTRLIDNVELPIEVS